MHKASTRCPGSANSSLVHNHVQSSEEPGQSQRQSTWSPVHDVQVENQYEVGEFSANLDELGHGWRLGTTLSEKKDKQFPNLIKTKPCTHESKIMSKCTLERGKRFLPLNSEQTPKAFRNIPNDVHKPEEPLSENFEVNLPLSTNANSTISMTSVLNIGEEPLLAVNSKEVDEKEKENSDESSIQNLPQCRRRKRGNNKRNRNSGHLATEHTCAICLDLFCLPMKIFPCQHTFCEPCLRQLNRTMTAPNNTSCPTCQTPIQQCKKDRDLQRWLSNAYPEEQQRQRYRRRNFFKRAKFPLPNVNQQIPRPLPQDANVNGIGHPRNPRHRWNVIQENLVVQFVNIYVLQVFLKLVRFSPTYFGTKLLSFTFTIFTLIVIIISYCWRNDHALQRRGRR